MVKILKIANKEANLTQSSFKCFQIKRLFNGVHGKNYNTFSEYFTMYLYINVFPFFINNVALYLVVCGLCSDVFVLHFLSFFKLAVGIQCIVTKRLVLPLFIYVFKNFDKKNVKQKFYR